MADISKIKPNGADGTEYDVKDATARSAIANKANNTQTFTEASTRTNIASGENMATLFGKIKKFFSDLKTVAFTGSYSDLTDQPTIPAAANNNTITIQLNGVTVKSFTLNQSTNETINIQVTKSSVGLGNVDNTADVNKSVNYATSAGSAGYATSAGSAGNAGKVLVEGENSGAYISVQAEGTTVIDSEHDSHYYFPSCKAVTSYLNSKLVRAKIAGSGNCRYCKITLSNSNQKYGEIIALAGARSFIGFLSGNSLTKAINGITDLTGTVNGNEVILDSSNIYAHWLVIISSSLAEYGTISFYN